ncbi:hypothetical protein ACQPW1_02250 [Nocardia sp. CA-128927]|uniref:hypothetical protein n=1 Tax=Nocardia sp. CA-128927 TaxID=3239975 RepID=UPI003D994CE7
MGEAPVLVERMAHRRRRYRGRAGGVVNAAISDNGSAITSFGDCLIDPGRLTRAEAIAAMHMHYACPRQCLPLSRADATLNAEYGAVPVATEQAANQKWDTKMAGLCQEAIRLVTRAQQRAEPSPPPATDHDPVESCADVQPAHTAQQPE